MASRQFPALTHLLTIALLAMTGGQVGAANLWPTFRGPSGDGVAPAQCKPPTKWSTTENIAFRTPLPGQGWSSPVVSENRIYLSAAIPQSESGESDKKDTDFELSLLIIDRDSGELIKKVALLDQPAEKAAKIHGKNSHASPTPILYGDRLYVHFGYQGTCCVDLNGDLIWKNRNLFFKPVHGNGGTPIFVDNRLIFTCDGAKDPKVVALDASTGKVAWEVARPVDAPKKFSFCTPTLIHVQGQHQIIAPGSNCVLAIAPKTGDVIWQLEYTGYSVVPKPLFHNGNVILSTSFDSPSMLSIDPTGNGDVTETHLQWTVKKNVPKTSSMIAHDGLIYSVSDNGVAMCVNAESGEIVYQKRLGGNFSASPVLAGDHIYFTDESGRTTVVKTGRQCTIVAENDLEERTLASMAVAGDSLIVRTADALYRIAD
ncbi:MAG: PQQ-binding-like beta-propeller repeat protein [Pirellulaceae bacterium]|nr:PQQ-binding-like beta-propeller repeat protein [Pirellulaceae bacterium]